MTKNHKMNEFLLIFKNFKKSNAGKATHFGIE